MMNISAALAISGIAGFFLTLISALTTICLMGADLIEFGPPPRFIFVGILFSVWMLVFAGLLWLVEEIFGQGTP